MSRKQKQTSPELKTAVIYARFSCSKQREASIEDQLRECRAWCSREGYEVVAEYCDKAISGRTDDRPEFQKMISNAGESSIVLVYMMDRFSRDPFDAPIYKRELQQHGVKLVSALENIPDSPEGIIYEKLLEGLAACESRKTSIRTRRGMEGNASKCLHNGVRCYGYDFAEDGRYAINDVKAEFVREAFRRRLEGEAINSIARDFASRGVRSYKGNPCSYEMIYQMLRNEKYTGVYEWGGVRVEGGMPAIISKEEFMATQLVKSKKQRKNEEWGEFALSGRVVCGACGHNMPGVSGRGSTGKKYDYYACKRCDMKAVRKDWLESEIAKNLRMILEDRSEATKIAQAVAKCQNDATLQAEKKQAQALKNEAERGLSNILAAIEKGLVVEGMQERADALREQKARAELSLQLVEEEEFDPEDFADFLQQGATLDDKTLLAAMVWNCAVKQDEVIVTLNYDIKKEPAQLTLERVLTDCEWRPVAKTRRTFIAAVGHTVYLRFMRAA